MNGAGVASAAPPLHMAVGRSTVVDQRRNLPLSGHVDATSAVDGVRTRRLVAFALDLMILGVINLALLLLMLVFTATAFAWLAYALPTMFAITGISYSALTVGSLEAATPGMRAMDLKLTDAAGDSLGPVIAGVHATFFYLSVVFTPVLLASMVATMLDPDKRMLHDLVVQGKVTRSGG